MFPNSNQCRALGGEKVAVHVDLRSLSHLLLLLKMCWFTGEGEIDDIVEKEEDRNEIEIFLSYPHLQ